MNEFLKKGERVVIKRSSMHYNQGVNNPTEDVSGTIIGVNSNYPEERSYYCYNVLWDNGMENCYRLDDIRKEGGLFLKLWVN